MTENPLVSIIIIFLNSQDYIEQAIESVFAQTYQHWELFERFGLYETKVRAAHSIYFQILGNHGFFGLFLSKME